MYEGAHPSLLNQVNKESNRSSGSSYQAGLKRWMGESRKDGEQSRLPLLNQDLEKNKARFASSGSEAHINSNK